jgi:hypothetical protein
MALAVTAGCGGGGSGGEAPVNAAQTGEVTVALRDAAGDFLQYAVDVTSIRLLRSNGDVVETLPISTRVDFAELVDLTEFVTSGTVPAGSYTKVVLGLDYSDAAIVVEGDDGTVLTAAAVDSAGDPLDRIDVMVVLPDDAPLRIAPGVPAHLTLDFDLDASNDVDTAVSPVRVTVAPFLHVTPSLETDRAHRLRGLLADVDVPGKTVTVVVRPFLQRSGEFGRVRFTTDAETQFEVDGIELTGSAGLAALDALGDGAPVTAQGVVSQGRLRADIVLAGSSVPWADAEVVHGVVTARAGGALTVSGVGYVMPAARVAFDRHWTVLIGDGTAVTGLGATGIDALSVGSRITASGEFADERTLDAGAGRVRLSSSTLTGRVVTVEPLTVAIFRLEGRRPAAFDFAGTGVTAAEDSDPARYEIDTGELSLDSLAVGDVVRVGGRVTDFGAAPPDFAARTIVDLDLEDAPAALAASWTHVGGTATPFLSMAPDRLDLDLADARRLLTVRGLPVAGSDALESIALVAPDAPGGYAIAVRGSLELHLYREFDDVVAELDDRLESGHEMARILAAGRYNRDTNALSTPRAAFELIAP